MAIQCLFYTPASGHPCQVFAAFNAPSLQQGTREQLEARYCTSGAFITCPVFHRVERGLVEADLLRSKPVEPATSVAYPSCPLV